MDWEEILLDGFDPGYRTGPTRERPEEVVEKVGESTIDLWDHPQAQLYQNNGYEDGDMRIGEEIIGNIDEDGYLTCSVEEVASTIDAKVEDVNRVLDRIQHFDPAGSARATCANASCCRSRTGSAATRFRIASSSNTSRSCPLTSITRSPAPSGSVLRKPRTPPTTSRPSIPSPAASTHSEKGTTSRRISSWRRSTESTS